MTGAIFVCIVNLPQQPISCCCGWFRKYFERMTPIPVSFPEKSLNSFKFHDTILLQCYIISKIKSKNNTIPWYSAW